MGLLVAIQRIGRRLARANTLAISRPIPLEGGGYVVATATATEITHYRAETLEEANSQQGAIIAGLNTGAGGFPVDVHVIEEARSVAEFEAATREYLGLPSRPAVRTPGHRSDSETL
jgi:hypothetical protein